MNLKFNDLLKKDSSPSAQNDAARRFFVDANSFTLVELLIVMGMIAFLTAAAVIFLNPAEYFARSRDTQRIADIRNLQIAIERYKYTGNRIGSLGTVNVVYTSLVDATSSVCADLGLPSLASGWSYNCVTSQTNLQKIDGTGWIPVNLSSIGLLASLSVDPTNTTSSLNYYSYLVNSTGQFELTATLESQKKLKDTALKDGGTDPAKFETGETLALWNQASGLIGWWPMDEGSGSTTADQSGNGYAGTLINGPTWTTGKIGYALNFVSASSTYVTMIGPGTNGNSQMTLMAWIKPTASPSTYSGFYIGYAQVRIEPSLIAHLIAYTPTPNYMNSGSTPSLPLNIWSHVAATYNYNGSTAADTVYYNGGSPGTGTGPNPGYIGASSAGSNRIGLVNGYFSGAIDDVRVYSRALSATEIQNIYTATK